MKKIFSFFCTMFVFMFVVACQQQAPTSSTPAATASPPIVINAPILGTLPSAPPKSEERKVELKVEKKDDIKDVSLNYEAYTDQTKLGKGKVDGPNNTATLTLSEKERDKEFTLSLTFTIIKDTVETGRAFLGIPIPKEAKIIVFYFEKIDGIIVVKYRIDGQDNKTTIEIK